MHPGAFRRWVRVGLALGTVGFAAGALSSWMVEPGVVAPRVPELATVAAGLLALVLAFRGRERLGTVLFLWAAFLEIHVSYFVYGILGPSLVVAPGLVAAFGLFLGSRAALTMGALSVALVAVAAWFEPFNTGLTSLEAEQLLLFTLTIATLAVLTAMAVRGLAAAGLRQRDMDARLHRSQRLAALGTLTGGIAHDFNNLLTVVRGSADLVRIDGGEAVAEPARDILEATERASAIVRQLMIFARRTPGRDEITSPAEELQRMEVLFRGLLGERIALTLDAPARGLVRADPGQLEDVLVNLVLNARDACQAGGAVEIEVTDARDARGAPVVRVMVADDGEGMDDEARTRSFDPFFTTRGVGRQGLGLATVHGILEEVGGSIDVETRPGHGTRVTVLWPALEPPEGGAHGADGPG